MKRIQILTDLKTFFYKNVWIDLQIQKEYRNDNYIKYIILILTRTIFVIQIFNWKLIIYLLQSNQFKYWILFMFFSSSSMVLYIFFFNSFFFQTGLTEKELEELDKIFKGVYKAKYPIVGHMSWTREEDPSHNDELWLHFNQYSIPRLWKAWDWSGVQQTLQYMVGPWPCSIRVFRFQHRCGISNSTLLF